MSTERALSKSATRGLRTWLRTSSERSRVSSAGTSDKTCRAEHELACGRWREVRISTRIC
eukprot:6174520-Pleurochrysis_carterae.AAC.2